MKRIRQSQNLKNQLAFIPTLTQYPGAIVGWSLRRLRAAYVGPCIRVRRASDNVETDIYFSGNWLDIQSIINFCAVGTDAFVVTVYDQTTDDLSDGNHLVTGGVATRQPIIYSAGAIILVNGRPAMFFDGDSDYFTFTPIDISFSQTFTVTKRQAVSTYGVCLLDTDGRYVTYLFVDNTLYTASDTRYVQSGVIAGVRQYLLTAALNRAVPLISQYINNVFAVTMTGGTASSPLVSVIGHRAGEFQIGFLQEVIIYSGSQYGNLSNINASINSAFLIY